jgi:GT2 family glycosyltransferase
MWSVTCNALGLNVLIKRPLFDPEALGGWDRGTERSVDIVSGCFFLIERGLWEALGGFHPDFFMYGEEADLCLRAARLGAKPMVTPEATIVHYGGASERVRGEKIAKVFLAKAKLLRRHWPGWAVWYGSLMLRARVLLRAGLYEASARARRHAGHREQADAWWTVWRLRGQWADGTAHAIETRAQAHPSVAPGAGS